MIYPEIVIAGCGNPVFADDGFGPAVAEELSRFSLPGNVKAVDAGLCGPQFIFSLLDPAETRKLIIIDIVEFGATPGAITLLQPRDFPKGCLGNSHYGTIMESLGQIDPAIELIILGCQPKSVPVPEMVLGLSEEVHAAIPKAVRIILEMIGVRYGTPCRPPYAGDYSSGYFWNEPGVA